MKDLNLDGFPDDIDINHFRVAIFGSARIDESCAEYKDVYNLSFSLAQNDIDVVTGGGPSLMQAANQGHKTGRKNGSNTHSFGLNIELPHEQDHNPYLDIKRDFAVFSKRLDAFMLLSNVVIVAPGGVGTLLEFFYAWQLVQVKHTCRMPIILMGDMWRGLIKWIKETPLKKGLLSPEDLDTIHLVNTQEEALELVLEAVEAYKKSGISACINMKEYGKRAKIADIL